MGKSLIPVNSKPPLGQQASLKYKPTFKPRKGVTTVSAGDSEVDAAQSKSNNFIGHKAAPTANSPIVTIPGRKQPLLIQKATTIPGPSKIVHGSGAEDKCSYIYTKPRREQLARAPPLTVTGTPAPQLRVQKRLPATSKAEVRNSGYIMPSTRAQKAASVSSYSPSPSQSIKGNTYSGYATPKSEQKMRLPQLAITKNPIPAMVSDMPIEQLKYIPPAPLEKATSTFQLVASEKIEPDNGLKNGQTGLEHEQPKRGPCIPINDGSQSVVSNTILLRHLDQSISDTGSGGTVKCAFSEAVFPVEEASKGIATAIGQTEKTSKKSTVNVVIGQAKDASRLDSEGDKEKSKGKKAVSDLEAPGGEGVDNVEMYEQMDSSEDSGLKSHPVGNILVENAQNAAAEFHPQTPAACNTLGQAIDQAIHALHSNPAAGPATSKMVLDHLGFAVIGHATIHGGHRPEAIKSLIENSLLKYQENQEKKERNSAKYIQQLGFGLMIQDHDMLDYQTDNINAAEDPKNYIMEDIEETGIQRDFFQGYSHLTLPTGMTPSKSITTSTDRTNLRFVNGRFEIEDEVMEDSGDGAAQVQGMLEYRDSDDPDTPRSTRSNSPELVTDSEIFTNGMDLDDMEDILSIHRLSLSTEPCTSKAPNNMGNSGNFGLEDTQYLCIAEAIAEAGDCIMAGSTEDVDSVGAGNIIMKTDCTQDADGAGKARDSGGSCSTKRPSDTKSVDKTGEKNTNKPDSTREPEKPNSLLVAEKGENNKDPGVIETSNHPTKEVVSLESSNGVGAVDSQELDKTEELSVTGGMETSGSGHIKEAHGVEPPLDTELFEDGENMSSPEVFDNPVSFYETVDNGENVCSPEGFDSPVSLDSTVVNSVRGIATAHIPDCIPHNDEEIAKFLGGAGTVQDGDIDSSDSSGSSVEICDGVRDADNVEFLCVLENIVPLTIFQTTDTDIGDVINSPVENVETTDHARVIAPLVLSNKVVVIEDPESIEEAVIVADISRRIEKVEKTSIIKLDTENAGQGLEYGDYGQCRDSLELLFNPEECVVVSEEQPDGERDADRTAGLSDEGGALEERKEEENETERVMANIKNLAPVYTSCQKKLKSWEGFIHSGKNRAPALAPKLVPVAVKAPTPTVVVTVIPKDIMTPTGNYTWGCIFPLMCILVLLVASGPAAILDRLQILVSTLGLQIYSKEIALLLLLLTRISLCWRSKETIKTNVSYVVRETIGLAWVVISCTIFGLRIIYTSGMDWINALGFAGVRSQPATSPLVQPKPEPEHMASGEEIVPIMWNNGTNDGVDASVSLEFYEVGKGKAVNEVSLLLPRLRESTISSLPPPILGNTSPRYILNVGGSSGTGEGDAGVTAGDAGVIEIGAGTLGLGMMFLLIVGGGGRRQLRRGGRR